MAPRARHLPARSTPLWPQGMPTVYLSTRAARRMRAYVAGCAYEISGLGTVRLLPSGGLLVDDVFLLPQTCTEAETLLDPEAVSQFLIEAATQGVVDGMAVRPEAIRCWWHSHAHMAVFWSMTDERTAHTWMHGWKIALVVNHRGEMLARLDVDHPVGLTMDRLPIEIYDPLQELERPGIAAEIFLKVRIKPSVDWSFGRGAHDTRGGG